MYALLEQLPKLLLAQPDILDDLFEERSSDVTAGRVERGFFDGAGKGARTF
jgi:hypothetical protein